MNRTELNFVKRRPRIVGFLTCWKCKKSQPELLRDKFTGVLYKAKGFTLRNLKYDNGKKSPDYACENCWIFGRPDIGNQSQINYKYD